MHPYDIVYKIHFDWNEVDRIREKLIIDLDIEDGDLLHEITMAVSELMENAVKYGDHKSSDLIVIRIVINHQKVTISVTNPVAESAPVKSLTERIEQLRKSGNPKKLYISRLKQLNDGKTEGIQLGIFRIAYEGGFKLNFHQRENLIEVTASKNIKLIENSTNMSIADANQKNPFKMLKIRWQLLIIILSVSVIPLMFIFTFVTTSLLDYLKQYSRQYYSTLLKQTASNLDFIYEQYSRTFYNMINQKEVRDSLNAPPYRSKIEENEISNLLGGDEVSKTGIRKTLQEKVEGSCFIIELDRKSLLSETPYKIHQIFGQNFDTIPNLNELLQDPLYLELINNSNIRLIFGKLKKGTLSGRSSDSPVFIYPFYFNTDETRFTKFMLIIVFPSFLNKFYSSVPDLKYGTLYVLDQFNQIIKANHPDTNDYYEYDFQKKRYILGEDDPNDPYEQMSFKEYQSLNTDPEILNTPEVRQILATDFTNQETLEEFNRKNQPVIRYKNINYLAMISYAELSNTRFIYFHPESSVYRPIFIFIRVFLFIIAISIISVIVISFLLSRNFTRPIQLLSEAASEVSSGNYEIPPVTISSGNELGILSTGFNQMVKKVKKYTENLENLVNDRTKELKIAHEKLQKSHDLLWSEIQLTKRIQKLFLKESPVIGGYDIYAWMMAAEEVSGDIYEIIKGEQKNWFVIGDVSGHGVTPGLIMMMAHVAIQTLLEKDPAVEVKEMFRHLNTVLTQNISKLEISKYLTVSILEENNQGEFRGCGQHNDIMIYRKDTQEVEIVETIGAWLGINEDIEDYMNEYRVTLKTGDLMLLSTDGLNHITDPQGRMFEDDLPGILKKNAHLEAKEIVNRIIQELMNFGYHDDDITLIVVKRQ